MTHEQYEEYKKVMQKAAYLRGRITDAKISVAHWTSIEDRVTIPAKKEWAKKKIEDAIKKLEALKKEFADLELFPENEIPIDGTIARTRVAFCRACNAKEHGVKSRIAIEHTCGLQEFDEPKNQKYRNKERNTDSLKPKY